MKRIRKEYNKILNNSTVEEGKYYSSIRKYAEDCESISELGVRKAEEAVAMMAKGVDKVTLYDLMYAGHINPIMEDLEEEGINFMCLPRNPIRDELDKADLFIISSIHTYNNVKMDLSEVKDKANKYIIVTGTEEFGYKNEAQQAGKKEGVVPAVEEFLQNNPKWEKIDQVPYGKGFIVMSKTN